MGGLATIAPSKAITTTATPPSAPKTEELQDHTNLPSATTEQLALRIDRADRTAAELGRADEAAAKALTFGKARVHPLLDSQPVAAGFTGQALQSAALDLDQEVTPQPSGSILARVPAGPTRPSLIERSSEPEPVSRKVVVARGDTLMNLMVKAGASRQDAYEAITALKKVYSPRAIRPGQEIRLAFAPGEGPDELGSLLSVLLKADVEQDIEVTRDDDGFVSRTIDHPLERVLNSARGTIVTSLSEAASEASVPANILVNAIRAFSYDVDFQREIQVGDRFEIFYETLHDEDGNFAKSGDVLYASLTLSGKQHEFYKHELSDGTSDYFTTKGESVRKGLMRTPVDGARLSSGFGMRRHPILGYSKMHRGVDFAAPRGTPVYAAGKGVVEIAGRKGAYGKYIRIRHNSSYKTAYAHLHRIAKGIRKGKAVQQGQIIGYVGSTGRSTGPHLHYEMILNGKQVNPRRVKMPKGDKLKGPELERFELVRAEVDRLRAAHSRPQLYLVEAACGPTSLSWYPTAGSC